ncbi:MAG: aspartate carbamoyltransferase regulatory subunit [Simkaniaceae bacterium]|nr:aspartate carbamoyltransferase regulatory subunit [Simkaniaceae bacterium]
MTEVRTRCVAAIENGTVIDHIPAGVGLAVAFLLDLPASSAQVTIGLSLVGKKRGLKDLIKIKGKHLTRGEIDRVAILAPGATINMIRECTVERKFVPELPAKAIGIFACRNPLCITNHEHAETAFHTEPKEEIVLLRCCYCQRTFIPDHG